MTSNRFRPPALLAKIAATVDVVSGGRLDFGIGAGSRPSVPMARREYDAHGLAYDTFSDSVAGLDEALTVIRRLWTETAGALLRVVAKHADVWNIPGGDLADAVQRGALVDRY